MCLATDHQFECVGCDRTVTGTMTIRQFCRHKDDVEGVRGRFVFPGTDDVIVFPKAGEAAAYYEGQQEERVRADGGGGGGGVDTTPVAGDATIPHHYFHVEAVFVGARFCKDCRAAKHRKDRRTGKHLDRSLGRIYREAEAAKPETTTQPTTEPAKAATEPTQPATDIFDGERCYHVPGAFDSLYDGPVRCSIM